MENPTIDPSEGEFKDVSKKDQPYTEGAEKQNEAEPSSEIPNSETPEKNPIAETPTETPAPDVDSVEEVNAAEDKKEAIEVPEEQEATDAQTTAQEVPENNGAEEVEAASDAIKDNDPKTPNEFDKEVLAKLTTEELVKAFQKISSDSEWMFKNTEIQNIRELFEEKFHEEINQVKTNFLNEGGNEIDFVFKPKYKEQFDHLSYEYRQRKRKHYKDLEATQKANLEKRQNIIEEIKQLINVEENINNVYKRFRALQESWHNSGSVPRSESQNMWQTYKHHVERFYDFLHLNRDLRDLDFKHNYEEKLKIIEKAEALIDLPDVMRANRDLNTLHRLWKNDLGPVAREHREDLWSRFQAATKIIHKKRNEYQKNIEVIFAQNLEKKHVILKEMQGFLDKLPKNHKEWQDTLKRFNELREEFKNVGYVPSNESKSTWKAFREIGRNYTHEKNEFYKKQKLEHKHNIDQKRALIDEVEQILESENWNSRSNEVKNLQNKWKKIGFIPRKIDNQLWGKFREKNNLFFDRLKSGYQKMSGDEEAIYTKKIEFIDGLNKNTIEEEEKEPILESIKKIWEEYQGIGTLNAGVNDKINNDLLKALSQLIKASKLPKKEHEDVIFECKLIIKQKDSNSVFDEIQQLRTKINSIKGEITQLENNLEFFSNSSADNPLFKEVQTKITRLIKNMNLYNDRLIRLKQLKNALTKQAQQSEVESSEEE